MAVLFLLLPHPKDFEHYLSYINTDIFKYTCSYIYSDSREVKYLNTYSINTGYPGEKKH